ncbi:hypothetical protein [Desulforhabdus sp. TSK]|nr:hypothetical protein [Desulforhabdus sp. TSK]GKT07380.1 hypothetical protein DSTSK_06850 [Desulforhabdus sp. TSK]
MEVQEKKTCRSGDSEYTDGSKVCCEGYCLVCKDGQWADTIVQKGSF